jgi:hypothetical protein
VSRRTSFALELHVDPNAADRAALARWPAAPLPVDFAVAAGGNAKIVVGGRTVAYRGGELVALPPGAPPPGGATAEIPEYLPAFALRLAETLPWLRRVARGAAGGERWAGMLESPAGLGFRAEGAAVEVGYREGEHLPPIYRARLPADRAAAVVERAVLDFRRQLLALNPRLAEHPSVTALDRLMSGA